MNTPEFRRDPNGLLLKSRATLISVLNSYRRSRHARWGILTNLG